MDVVRARSWSICESTRALTCGWPDREPQAGPGSVDSGPGSPHRADRVSPPSGPAGVSAPASVAGSGNRSDVGSPLGDRPCASGSCRSGPTLWVRSARNPTPLLGRVHLCSSKTSHLVLGPPRPELTRHHMLGAVDLAVAWAPCWPRNACPALLTLHGAPGVAASPHWSGAFVPHYLA